MSSIAAQNALLSDPTQQANPETPLIVRVARLHGVSPLRQLGQMARLSRLPNGVRPAEYYSAGLFRPGLDAAARQEFVGRRGNLALNRALSSPRRAHSQHVHDHKMRLGALLAGFGLRTPETQAVFARKASFGALPVLRDVAAIEAFLRGPARYPLFAKPANGSLSVGSALIEAVDTAAGILRLGNGREVGIAGFAEEIATRYPAGFLFQTRIAPHSLLAEVAGAALGTVRVVTVMDGEGDDRAPRVLYAVWKLPSREAMSDSSWQAGNMQALVELSTGRVLRCGHGTELEIGALETHPVSGRPLPGLQMPHWPAVMAAAEAAHSLLSNCGVLGWDIGIAADGPVVLEANDNPHHMLFQRAADRGILNPEFLPVFDRLRAAAKAAARAKPAAARRRAG